MAKKEKFSGDEPLARNRKAWHDYEIIDSMEAGLELVGTEVKSCRARAVSLAEALPLWFWLLFAALFGITAAQCGLLFFSRAVSEFMYGQSSGR